MQWRVVEFTEWHEFEHTGEFIGEISRAWGLITWIGGSSLNWQAVRKQR